MGVGLGQMRFACLNKTEFSKFQKCILFPLADDFKDFISENLRFSDFLEIFDLFAKPEKWQAKLVLYIDF